MTIQSQLQKLDAAKIRADFPIFTAQHNTPMNGRAKPLVYLDSAATSQRPQRVIDCLKRFYEMGNANIHRGIYQLSEDATGQYENAHGIIADFIGAKPQEIIFTKNATEAINLVAYAYGLHNLHAGDNIVLTIMEHHSNLVPWQQLAAMKGATLRFVDIDADGQLQYGQFETLVDEKTKIVAVAHASNVLATINDIKRIRQTVKKRNPAVLLFVDGAQSIPHFPVDVKELDCDFLAFSGHKMCGPTGIGVLYGKEELLHALPPFLFGGGMIRRVTKDKTTFNDLPWKFEAGTPPIAEGIALAEAVLYLKEISMENIAQHEQELRSYALERLDEIPEVKIYGNARQRITGEIGTAPEVTGIISFNFGDVHAHDLATVLDRFGIAIRVGHHCCQPLMEQLGVVAAARVSFYIYNTKEEIDYFIETLKKVKEVFRAGQTAMPPTAETELLQVHQMYREHLLDHYSNPRNRGKLENGALSYYDVNPLCGDEVEISIQKENGQDENGQKIADARFIGRGCVISQAAASLLTEAAKGMYIEEIKKIDVQFMQELLGITVSAARVKCMMLPATVLKTIMVMHEEKQAENTLNG